MPTEEVPFSLPEFLLGSLKIEQSQRRFNQVNGRLIEAPADNPNGAYEYAQYGELKITAQPEFVGSKSPYPIANHIAGRIREIRVVYLRCVRSTDIQIEP